MTQAELCEIWETLHRGAAAPAQNAVAQLCGPRRAEPRADAARAARLAATRAAPRRRHPRWPAAGAAAASAAVAASARAAGRELPHGPRCARDRGRAAWAGARGFISEPLLRQALTPPDADSALFVCGPPPMYEDLCGPRGVKEITGVLKKLGYRDEQVVKF